MSRLPVPGSDDSIWGTVLNDYLSQSINNDGTLKASAISASGAELTANKGQANGYAGLDTNAKVGIGNLPTGTSGATVAIGNDVRFAGAAAGTVNAALAATDPTTTNSRIPTGSAGGDLSGTYPSPTVAKLNGVTVSGVPATGQLLTATGATTASWQTGMWFNVRSYGATGNGTSDDSTAINAAIAAAAAAGGGVVYLCRPEPIQSELASSLMRIT